jgi:hypothetical protein
MFLHQIVERVSKFLRNNYDMCLKENKDNFNRHWQKELLLELLDYLKRKEFVKAASKIATIPAFKCCAFISEILTFIYRGCCKLIGEDFQLELFPDHEFDEIERAKLTEKDEKALTRYRGLSYAPYKYQCYKYWFLPAIFEWFFHRGYFWRSSNSSSEVVGDNSVQLSLWSIVL